MDLIEECNRLPCPLRSFINRSMGLYDEDYEQVRRFARRLVEDDADPQFFDVSEVRRPADRIAFVTAERMGRSVGNTAGLDRIDLG